MKSEFNSREKTFDWNVVGVFLMALFVIGFVVGAICIGFKGRYELLIYPVVAFVVSFLAAYAAGRWTNV